MNFIEASKNIRHFKSPSFQLKFLNVKWLTNLVSQL